jgi:orotate phosphoribosyltransferase
LTDLHQKFIRFALDAGVLMFGEFTTKAKRQSPYFFNTGLFNQGQTLGQVAGFYAKTLIEAERLQGLSFDMLFGPAYKGITLASATAVALAQIPAEQGGRNVPFAFNRKEAKDHGEGGQIVGARLSGRVVIVDDVISAGTSVRESVEMIRAAGATPAAVLIALDRMERGGDAQDVSDFSAVQDVEREYELKVFSIVNLNDILHFLGQSESAELARFTPAVRAYRARYGVS